MKKLMSVVMPVKSFAALIFTGFITLYVVMGFLYANIVNEPFDYAIPFVFVLQGLVLSVLISALWAVLIGDEWIRNMRYFLRLTLFSAALIVLLAVSFSLFMAIPAVWAKLWLIDAVCVASGVVILSIIGEFYFRATGKRYTKALEEYKERRR